MTSSKPSTVVAASAAAAPPAAAAATSSAGTPNGSSSPAASKTQPGYWLFVVLAITVIVWWCLLAGLVLTVSNPIVISTPQVVTADAIVVARVLEWPSESTPGHVRVVRRIHGDLNEGAELTLPNLSTTAIATAPRTQTDWILPLLKLGNEYSVVRLKTQSPRSLSLVYPATQSAIEDVLRVLANASGTPVNDGEASLGREASSGEKQTAAEEPQTNRSADDKQRP